MTGCSDAELGGQRIRVDHPTKSPRVLVAGFLFAVAVGRSALFRPPFALCTDAAPGAVRASSASPPASAARCAVPAGGPRYRSEEHTAEPQSRENRACRPL